MVLILLSQAAFIGDKTNYFVGQKIGHRLFSGPAVVNFKSRALHTIQIIFSQHHPSAIICAHFFPALRGNSPFIAGATKVPYRHFLTLSLIGSCIWVSTVVPAGYLPGKLSIISSNLPVFILSITILSSLPPLGIIFRMTK
ncbi:VTT domain-containing protein [Aquitalea pelogenes]|uniref:VTT domain-containing protein n=1 Tax=Aquitalea pelogenes TaxID=1293573 RepID=UPI0009EB7779